jgi:CBS domain-containing protein
MAKTVKEIMNPELFSFRSSEKKEDAFGYILALDITAAPVLGADREPIGMVSLRDLLAKRSATIVEECMRSPVVTIAENAAIDHAAHLLAEKGVHRLVAVDGAGRATGMVSALDVIRGLVGLPASHPSAFPHYDRATGVTFCDDTLLELSRLHVAPDGPGVLALISGGKGKPEHVVWAEASNNVRTRLYEMLSRPDDDDYVLRRLLRYTEGLRFRAALVPNAEKRARIAAAILSEVRHGVLQHLR